MECLVLGVSGASATEGCQLAECLPRTLSSVFSYGFSFYDDEEQDHDQDPKDRCHMARTEDPADDDDFHSNDTETDAHH